MSRFLKTCNLSLALVALLGSQFLSAQQQNRPPQQQVTQQPSAQPNANQAGPTVQIPIMSPADAVAAGVARLQPQQPFAPLTPVYQNYLDGVLVEWEKRTATVDRFQCEFLRWEFNPATHPTAATSISKGLIKFAKPDKGLFRVDEIGYLASAPQEKPVYKRNDRKPFGDYWICDGSWVHSLDRNDKKAVRTELPPQMAGNQIHMSPIPFLFGVKAEELKQRYWLRPLPPPNGNKDVWLEAYPKRADDAGNYSKVEIVLDSVELLPKALTVYLPQATPESPNREVYEFSNRDQMDGVWDKVKQNVFMQNFIDTKLDSTWEVIVEPFEAQVAAMQAHQAAMQQQQLRAQQPASQAENRIATPSNNVNR